MSKGVQTAYDSVLGRAQLALVDVQNPRHAVASARVGVWEARSVPWWVLAWSGLRGYDLRLVERGRPGPAIPRPPRSWALHAPGTVWEERLAAPEPDREFIWLFFSLSGELPPLSPRAVTVVMDEDDRLAPLARTMRAAVDRGAPGDPLIAHGLLLAMLGEVLAASQGGGSGDDRDPWSIRAPGSRRRVSGLLAAVDAQVVRSLARPPSRAQLARALGMSESALAHRFRAETGLTLVDRIRWLRIREARAQLAERGASVKAVASALGFSSAAWFSRVFHEVAGMTAEDYLRQSRA